MALGGPYALHRGEEILKKSCFDWVFSGSADHTFPEAIARHLHKKPLATNIKGLSYRKSGGDLHVNDEQDNIKELDTLPMPYWDLIDLDAYASKRNLSNVLKGKRYAQLFTSRGCPYLCNYCHDIFSKKFVHQSPERVLKEIEYLYEVKGVDEFQIVDDIFNLHKPRLKQIMSEVIRRWPGKLKFTFPNGLRGDILDAECIELLAKAGTYYACIAIETVTPRLQELVEKHLHIDNALWSIKEFDKHGVAVSGFFMLGLPSETEEEMKQTVHFALNSGLTIAHFFKVMPQPETPLFAIAQQENQAALTAATEADEEGGGYSSTMSWYELAYGFPLDNYLRKVYMQFYFNPKNIWRIWRRIPTKSLFQAAFLFLKVLVLRINKDKSSQPINTTTEIQVVN